MGDPRRITWFWQVKKIGAIWIDLDPKIWENGSEDPENWISGSGSICRALKKKPGMRTQTRG